MKQEVLVIDDNFDIRNLTSEILKDKNYDVREAANFDQAVSEIKKKLPDIAVIDVKLDKGDKDGSDLLKLIKGLTDLVPVFKVGDLVLCQHLKGDKREAKITVVNEDQNGYT